jgi:hypothetical protein
LHVSAIPFEPIYRRWRYSRDSHATKPGLHERGIGTTFGRNRHVGRRLRSEEKHSIKLIFSPKGFPLILWDRRRKIHFVRTEGVNYGDDWFDRNGGSKIGRLLS